MWAFTHWTIVSGIQAPYGVSGSHQTKDDTMPEYLLGQSSQAKPMLSSNGRSAENAVSIALVGVCVAVSAAIWFLQSEDATQKSSENTAAATAADAGNLQVAEQAALGGWLKKLQGDFGQLEQQRQMERQKADLDQRAELARLADAEQRKLAEIEQRKLAAALVTTPAATTPRASTTAPATGSGAAPLQPGATVATLAPATGATRTPVLLDAKVDWSTCRRPEYPERSVTGREEGVVVMRFDVDVDGKIVGSRISQSSGFDRLDQAALRAVSKCRFTPAQRDGAPTDASTLMRFAWKLG